MSKQTGKDEELVKTSLPDRRTIEVEIVGDSTLITNRFSDKAQDAIAEKQTSKQKGGKNAKADRPPIDPEQMYEDSKYRHPGNKDVLVFPGGGIKKCIEEAAPYAGAYKTRVQAAIFVMEEWPELKFEDVRMRRDMPPTKAGTPHTTYRAEFVGWFMKFPVLFDATQFSVEDVINLFERGGFHIGIGEWRPKGKRGGSGMHGMFHVRKKGEKV